MTNTTYNPSTFKPAATSTASATTALLTELFKATPLYIFVTAAIAAYTYNDSAAKR